MAVSGEGTSLMHHHPHHPRSLSTVVGITKQNFRSIFFVRSYHFYCSVMDVYCEARGFVGCNTM
jgi:hypothetical protein